MKVACIHALPASVKPMQIAFQNKDNVEVYHLLDSYLLTLLEEHGTFTEAITTRFMNMFDMAVRANVDVIQLTCSSFNSLVPKFRPLFPNIRMYRSDEALLDQAIEYERIAIISSMESNISVFTNYILEHKPAAKIVVGYVPEAIDCLNLNDQEGHDRVIINKAIELAPNVDVIVLGQFSMAHLAERIHVDIPVLNAPDASVARCLGA